MVGKTISHYEIVEKLGEGGMGVVYKARDTRLDRDVALKFLPTNLVRDAEAKERFIQEAKAASSLDDPHICTIYEIGEAEDGQLFIAMAFYDGSTLQELMERRSIKIDDAASIARQMAKGLATAHEAGIVHRDVKPANVMVTRKGLVKLLDFGVAKLGESSDLTREGSTIGTASYMSPEQARGEQVDARSDIWSIGAVLYEMLTGARPFGGGYEAAVAYSVINEEPPPISNARPDTPEPLIELVGRVLSKDVNARPADASSLAEELGVFSGETVVETAQQPAYPSATKQEINTQQIAIRFAVIGAIVLAVVYGAMMAFGLPGWVFPAAVLLTLAGLPITLYAANVERKRASLDSAERKKLTGLKATLSTRLALRGGMFAAAGLLIAVLAYSGLRAAGIGPFASLITSGELDREDTIVLTDFENRTDIPELGSTVSEALRIDLSQSTVLNIMDRSLMSDALQRGGFNPDTLVSASLGLDISRREGVKAIIEGEIAPVGSAFQIAARVVASDDEQLLAGFRETAASEADIVSAIDRLSARLRSEIGESLVDIRSSPPLDQVSTSSLAALRHYTKANIYQDQNLEGAAIREIEQAIELDSLFGMAYRKLAVLYRNNNYRFQTQDTLRQKAYDLRDRMTERERLTTEGTIYAFGALNIEEDRGRSIRAYEELLEKWPEDLTALNNLAAQYNMEGRYLDAETLFRRAARSEDGLMRRANIALTILRQGRYEDHEAFVDSIAMDFPGSAEEMENRASLAYTKDDIDGALRWVEKRDSILASDDDPFTRSTPENYMSLLASQGKVQVMKTGARAWLASAEGREVMTFEEVPDSVLQQFNDYVDVEAEWAQALATDNYEQYRSANLKQFAFSRLEADEFFDDDGDLNWVWAWSLQTAIEFMEADRIDSLLAVSDSVLETELDEDRRELVIQARAVSDVFRGIQPASAIERYRALIAPNALRHPFHIVGRLEEEIGNVQAAIDAYTRFVSHPSTGYGGEDKGRTGRIHFRLGELYEEQGDLDQAIFHYQKVVDRWKDGDAYVQPTVTEARRRIDQLLDRKAQEPS